MSIQKKQSGSAGRHLPEPVLRLLLSDDDTNEPFRIAAMHLENCETCQAELTLLAANASWWNDTQQLLSNESEPRWEPDLSQLLVSTPDAAQDCEANNAQVLKLLGAPNHPEMLGRLGRYDIEKVIGSGGMGIVLKAHDSELNRPIAIKLLSPHLSHVGAARERFAREGRAAAAVVHEHVVAIYNVEADETPPFLIMQYVPGRSLQARVDEDGPLSVEEILRIGLQAAAGLAAAHAQGLVHRDVKPSNILLEDGVERAVLTDFGLARAMDDASLTQTGILAGTPSYMSPEQATGLEIDARSDLFSLGAVLYFMATARPPFRADGALAVLHRLCRERHRPVWQLNKEVPDELCDVIDRLLEKKPGRRFSSAAEVHQRLSTLLSRVQLHGLGLRRFGKWRMRDRRRYVLIGIAAIVSVLAVGTAIWLGPTGSQSRELNSAASKVGIEPAAARDIPFPTKADAESAARRETEYFTTLKATEESIDGASRESVYLRGNDSEWRRELEILKRELDKVESRNR